MGPQILESQNCIDNLRCLAAQRQLYSNAKNIFSAQIALSIITVVILSLINLKWEIQWLIATYCVIITIIDLAVITELLNSLKNEAAKIQELFDTNVLKINWNTLIDKPDNEIIFRHSEKYRKTEPTFDSLKNWYSPEIKNIQSEIAKIICQYSNCSYDHNLRKDFNTKLTLLAGISALFIIIFSSIKGVTIENFFITVLLPLLPIIIFTIQKYKENNKSIDTSIKMKQLALNSIEKLTDETVDILALSRELQNTIYQNRKDSPLIFDWFYKSSRNKLESEMDYSVESLVKQFLKQTNTH